jgi:hypothetical protein
LPLVRSANGPSAREVVGGLSQGKPRSWSACRAETDALLHQEKHMLHTYNLMCVKRGARSEHRRKMDSVDETCRAHPLARSFLHWGQQTDF